MGCVVGSLASSVACCFGSAACHLCCACLPSAKNSTSTRAAYAGLLLLGAIVCLIMLAPGLSDHLAKIPYLCNKSLFNVPGGGLVPIPNPLDRDEPLIQCKNLVGYQAVYRVCFAMACFFFLFAVIMIGVRSSRDPRAKIQNGFWFFKIIILVGLCVGAFYIPYGDSEGSFAKVWMGIGMAGAFCFIILQMILLVDFVHSWNESWISKYEDSENKGWYCALVSFTLLFFSVVITAVVLFYIYYAQPGCEAHQTFVSVNLILTIVVSIVSILPRVQEGLPYSGLLQSSAISAYAMYLTWSAMANNPDRHCNPSLFSHETPLPSNSTTTPGTIPAPTSSVDAITIVGIFIWFGSVVYSCIRNSSQSRVGRLTLNPGAEPVVESGAEGTSDDREGQGQQVWDNETEQVTYSYTMFHVLLMMSAMYVMMMLTNWFSPSEDLRSLSTNAPAMWVKIASSWFVYLLYLWTLVAPIVFPDRDFS